LDALTGARAAAAAALVALLAPIWGGGSWAASARAEVAPASGARVEARSAELLAVGTVHGAHMVIHVSRISDNGPVRDASVTVVLRGTSHPAVAEADGSYAIDTPDLEIPGAAAIEFQVGSGSARRDLLGTLEVGGPSAPNGDKGGSSRQLGWWILNFGVCFGFLFLWSRRKKRRDAEDESP
jgi:hypothetical protein